MKVYKVGDADFLRLWLLQEGESFRLSAAELRDALESDLFADADLLFYPSSYEQTCAAGLQRLKGLCIPLPGGARFWQSEKSSR